MLPFFITSKKKCVKLVLKIGRGDGREEENEVVPATYNRRVLAAVSLLI